jgi:hypothetical protein
MNTPDLLVIALTIPITFLIGILLMVNHEYKKTLRRPPKNREDFKNN